MIDTGTCQDGPKVRQEESVIVNADGGLKNVVVYLKDAPASDGSTRPQAVLDQVGCRYEPHVLAIQVGQPLKITTSDAFLHNVHYTDAGGGDQNFGISNPSESKVVTFDQAQLVNINCNVHPWMNATVAVTANPFFGVSAADGTFAIARVPPGHYTLVASHPILGERTATVDVGADGKTEADFDYTAAH